MKPSLPDGEAWDNGSIVLQESAPHDAEPNTTHYTIAAEALHHVCRWVFLSDSGQVRRVKDAKCRLLAAASVINPQTFQPHNYAKAAKQHGFTRALLSLRVKEFSQVFGVKVRSTHGASTTSHQAQRRRNGWL